ncbi:MAG: hypothetical protein GC129_06825 [Proteobacteria bacterium]|nr:hypothetical protein [Pseudomonadota bacterium]
MIPYYFVFLAAFINLIGGVSYVVETYRGNTKPNRVSWFLWALAPMVAVAAQLASGIGWSTLIVFMTGFCPLLVFIASFTNPHAYWQLTWLDYACGILSLVGLILWAITKDPVLAVVFSILSDGLAALPTILKSYTNPETEDANAFIFAAIGTSLAFFTIEQHSFIADGFTVYIIGVCVLLSVLISRKHLKSFRHDA